MTDLHVGAGGALPVATGLFAAHAKAGLMDDAAVNFETNAATHNAARSLDEVGDKFATPPPLLYPPLF